MVISILALLVCIIGLLIYVLASNPKLSEIGRLMFFAGLLATLLAVGQKVVHLF
jgi:Na+/phosphate symporter